MRDGSNASSLAVVVRGLVLGLVGVAVLIPLVQALIVIPLRSSRTLEANEIAAIQSLREIYSAEIEYQKNYPGKGFACSLSALGGTTTYGPPSSQSAHLLHGYLAAGQKSGYSFSIDNCTRVSLKPSAHLYRLRSYRDSANLWEDREARLLHRSAGRGPGRPGWRRGLQRSSKVNGPISIVLHLWRTA